MMTTLYGAISHGKRNILMLCGKTGFHKDERLYDDYVQVQSAGVLCPWEVGENPALSRSGDGNETLQGASQRTVSMRWEAAME